MLAMEKAIAVPPLVYVVAASIAFAALQTLALRQADLGVAYIAVLGLEAVMAFGFGVAFFHEAVSAWRVLAVTLIVGGIAILR